MAVQVGGLGEYENLSSDDKYTIGGRVRQEPEAPAEVCKSGERNDQADRGTVLLSPDEQDRALGSGDHPYCERA